MPKFNIPGFGDEVLTARAGDFAPYEGPIPPKGTILAGVVKQFQLTKNRNDELMLKCLHEAKGNEGDKAKYNGLPTWWNGNVTKDGAGFVNDFLTCLALNTSHEPSDVIYAFWKGGGPALENDKLPSPIKAIGRMVVDSNGIPARISTRVGSYKGQEKSEVGFWIIPKKDGETPSGPSAVMDAGDGIEPEIIDEDAGDDTEVEFTDEPPF